MTISVCGSCGNTSVEEIGMKSGMAMENEPDEAGFDKKRKKAKKRRAETKGIELDSIVDSEDGSFSQFEAEGFAEIDFGLKVVDSGYASEQHLYIVQMERKDGRVIEAFYDAANGELEGWLTINDDISGEKGIVHPNLITADAATEIASALFEGEFKSVDSGDFDGTDSWVVSIDSGTGKAYDVFVSVEGGEALGYDEYEVGMKSSEDEKMEDTDEELEDELEDEKPEEKSEEVETEVKTEEVEEVEVKTEEEVSEVKSEEVDASELLNEWNAFLSED